MKSPGARLRKEPDREPKTQYAAIPWRARPDGGIEVLVITSRDTGRWVIPKGWPIRNLGPHRSAAQEAFEEAGVTGTARGKALGVYHYDKRLKTGRSQHVRVLVFPLEVKEILDDWPEKAERERRWVPAVEASTLVAEPELRKILAGFAP